MTENEARRELQNYHSLLLQEKNAIAMLRDLEARAFSVKSQDYEKTFVDGGVKLSTVELAYEQVEKHSRQLGETINKCRDQTQSILENIKAVGGVLSEVLMKRYIFRQKFEKIAVDLSYDYRSIMRLHKRSLEEYSAIKNYLVKSGSCHKMS